MRILTSLIIILSINLVSAEYSARTASLIKKYKAFSPKEINSRLQTVGGEKLIPIIAVLNEEYIHSHALQDDFKIGSQYSKYITLYLKPKQLDKLIENRSIKSFEISEPSGEPEILAAANDAKVHLVHDGFAMPQNFTGKDVILGIIDGGFDYTHPNFYDSTLQNYRVVAAWDQRTEGNPPEGYSIGSAYYGKEELLNAKRDTEEIQERWGTHGTHVAGIAGGSGGGTIAKGVAYESDFIFLTKIEGDAGLFDAFNWMSEVAEQEGKRLVINMSFGGLHSGTRDGTNPLGELMTELQNDKGVIFVGSAGNNGRNEFHLMRDFASDTLKTWLRPGSPQFWGNRIIALGEAGKNFKFNLRVRDYDNFENVIHETEYISTLNDNLEIDTFFAIGDDPDTLFYKIIVDEADPYSGRPRVDFFVDYSPTKRVSLEFTAENGIVHMWNVMQRDLDQTSNIGGRFSRFGSFEGFESGDQFYGLGEPGLNDAVITTAAHSHYDKRITDFSSNGPRIDGVIKPDISAPGFQVLASIANFAKNDFPNTISTEFNGETYTFGELSGTSMSAPLVAGICALILEAKPDITGTELKALIKATASLDQFTGDIPDGGSTLWGAGKIDAFSAILEVLDIINNVEINTENNILLYPNPAQNKLKLIGINSGDYYEIFDNNGLKVKAGNYQNEINISELISGIYFIKINNKKAMKFIVK